MKAQHTRGSWQIRFKDGIAEVAVKDGTIVQMPSSNSTWKREEIIANAFLIAAAPKMLEALRSVKASVPFADYRGDGELEECEELVRDALLLARGSFTAYLA